MHNLTFDAILAEAQTLCTDYMDRFLPAADSPPQRLHQAMRYSVFAGGKRLRPALILACSRALGGQDQHCLPLMAAVEMLHTYTLVHDDLPAMDDDDTRRGQASCHKAYDEATAILCGDALLTAAMGCIAQHSAAAVTLLADACGSLGVVGGQQDDLDAEDHVISAGSEALLLRIHSRKTAALLSVSCELGALAAAASAADQAACKAYGEALGLAFQMTDDLLDVTANSQSLGKTAGKDQHQNKLTSVRLYGIEGTRSKAAAQITAAKDALSYFGHGADTLRQLADFILTRNS